MHYLRLQNRLTSIHNPLIRNIAFPFIPENPPEKPETQMVPGHFIDTKVNQIGLQSSNKKNQTTSIII